MAKRRTKKHHHRRRVGAAKGMGAVVQKVLGIAAGAAGGMYLNDALKKSFASLPTFVPGAVVLVGGVFVNKSFGSKNALIDGVSTGLIASGALVVMNETFIDLPGVAGVGFITNYDKAMKNAPALNRAVGAPGFMDNAVGTVRDLASVGSPYMGAIFDN